MSHDIHLLLYEALLEMLCWDHEEKNCHTDPVTRREREQDKEQDKEQEGR